MLVGKSNKYIFKVIASFLIGFLIVLNISSIAFAEVSTSNELNYEDFTLESQLDDLYKKVGAELNIDSKYIKILHLLAGGKAIYADSHPNIYNETVVEDVHGPFDIEGTTTEYKLSADWAYCGDDKIKRPNKYYLPDAAYNVASDIVKIMNERYLIDRGSMQPYFDALKTDVKIKILFTEAVLQYTGSSAEAVNAFHIIYEKILYEKDRNENVVEVNDRGELEIKDKFKSIFKSNFIASERELKYLAIILSFDDDLAISDNADNVKDEYVLPYKPGYTSRENMMLAAMSLVGKVRYVWGGGHLTTGAIRGINPIWYEFFKAYEKSPDGKNKCLKPSNNWCPIHGYHQSQDACLFKSRVITNMDEYLEEHKGIIDESIIKDEKFKQLIGGRIDLQRGIQSHRLDGLDCSGFASWLYNQIDLSRNYDATASNFVEQCGLELIPYGSEMLPGDTFSWSEHIVVIVGKVRDGSRAYVTVEATPNMVKFGGLYYSDANPEDIKLARQIATEANIIFGDIKENAHLYNIDRVGKYEIGRFMGGFLDENIIIPEYNKPIKSMTAIELIQYILNQMPESYIKGVYRYTGNIFNIDNFKVSNKILNIIRSYSVKGNGVEGEGGAIKLIIDN